MVGETMEVLIIAFLWRMGGAGIAPFRKNWRRVGVPIVVLFALFWSGYSEFQAIGCAVALFLALRLPLTLIGDSLYDHWLNWPWAWVAGYIIGLSSIFVLGWSGFLFAFIPAVAQGASVTLSNIPKTATDFPHEACEILTACAFSLFLITKG